MSFLFSFYIDPPSVVEVLTWKLIGPSIKAITSGHYTIIIYCRVRIIIPGRDETRKITGGSFNCAVTSWLPGNASVIVGDAYHIGSFLSLAGYFSGGGHRKKVASEGADRSAIRRWSCTVALLIHSFIPPVNGQVSLRVVDLINRINFGFFPHLKMMEEFWFCCLIFWRQIRKVESIVSWKLITSLTFNVISSNCCQSYRGRVTSMAPAERMR